MRKTKILATGLNGYLGSRFLAKIKNNFQLIEFNHQNKKDTSDQIVEVISGDITNRSSTITAIAKSDAEIVLHLAAKTHIDKCEKDRTSGKKSSSWQINVIGTKNIADACYQSKKHLIYLSTECIFDGKSGWYEEADIPNPINWYGVTKFQGEQAIIKSGTNFCILRSTLAFGHPQYFPNDLFSYFLTKIKNQEEVVAVADQFISLTYIDDLINVINLLIIKRPNGIYHYAGNTAVSPYQFAKKLIKLINANSKIKSVSLTEFFGSKAKLRLKNASLSSDKTTREFNIRPSDIYKALTSLISR